MKLTYWDWVVSEVIHAVKVQQFKGVGSNNPATSSTTELTEKDLDLIVSVLRGNVPFIEDEEPFIEDEEPFIEDEEVQ